MNNARMRAIEEGQTGIAKKVLASVPIQEAWTARQIVSDIARSGSRPDPHIIEGCLNTLVDSGLVNERPRGYFQRIKPKEEKVVPIASAPAQPKEPIDPLAKLGSIASSLRTLADEIEDVALTIEERQTATTEEIAKLRQLKALLRDLG